MRASCEAIQEDELGLEGSHHESQYTAKHRDWNNVAIANRRHQDEEKALSTSRYRFWKCEERMLMLILKGDEMLQSNYGESER